MQFAPNFPFPHDIRLFKTIALSNRNGVEVVAYAPFKSDDSYQFLLAELPRAGYALGYRDSEPGEAEAQFSGHGWTGSFWVRSVFTCPTITEWVVVVSKN